MKHLKLFEDIGDIWLRNMRLNSIREICKKYGIENCTLNSDGSVDVDGNVDLSSMDLTEIPLKFGRVGGYFYCSNNKLTTLKGSPREVGGNFNCINNQLKTLEGGPREVGVSFYCSHNQLTTLEGAPHYVGRSFDCSNNQLTTLKGAPEIFGGYFDCDNNPVYKIYRLFKDKKEFLDSLDWDYIRGNNIVRSRFEEACEEVGIEMPESIEGYEYI
jgi:hypothetical protein